MKKTIFFFVVCLCLLTTGLFGQYMVPDDSLIVTTVNGDVNCSGTIDIDDVISLAGYIFESSAPPCKIQLKDTTSFVMVGDIHTAVSYTHLTLPTN